MADDDEGCEVLDSPALRRALDVAGEELNAAVLRIAARLHSEADQEAWMAIFAIGAESARVEARMRTIHDGLAAGKPVAAIFEEIGGDPAALAATEAQNTAAIERMARLLEVPFRKERLGSE